MELPPKLENTASATVSGASTRATWRSLDTRTTRSHPSGTLELGRCDPSSRVPRILRDRHGGPSLLLCRRHRIRCGRQLGSAGPSDARGTIPLAGSGSVDGRKLSGRGSGWAVEPGPDLHQLHRTVRRQSRFAGHAGEVGIRDHPRMGRLSSLPRIRRAPLLGGRRRKRSALCRVHSVLRVPVVGYVGDRNGLGGAGVGQRNSLCPRPVGADTRLRLPLSRDQRRIRPCGIDGRSDRRGTDGGANTSAVRSGGQQ